MKKINIHLKSLKFLVVEKVVALNIKVEHCFFFPDINSKQSTIEYYQDLKPMVF